MAPSATGPPAPLARQLTASPLATACRATSLPSQAVPPSINSFVTGSRPPRIQIAWNGSPPANGELVARRASATLGGRGQRRIAAATNWAAVVRATAAQL